MPSMKNSENCPFCFHLIVCGYTRQCSKTLLILVLLDIVHFTMPLFMGNAIVVVMLSSLDPVLFLFPCSYASHYKRLLLSVHVQFLCNTSKSTRQNFSLRLWIGKTLQLVSGLKWCPKSDPISPVLPFQNLFGHTDTN